DDLKSIAEKEGLAITLCRADITNDKGLEQLDRSLQEVSRRLSGLVHCAATGVHRPIEELTERHFDWTLNLNVRAFFKLVKLLMTRFSQGSSIVAVSSWGSVRALPYYSFVGSSKGALEALARHLAVELAPRGIRVNIFTADEVAYGAQFLCSDAAAGIIGHTLVLDNGMGIVA